MDAFRNGAAGVARSASPIGRSLNRSSAKLFRPEDFAELTTITASRYRARASRPSAALSVASQLLVDAAASPPLRGGEYSTFQHFFNSTQFHRPPPQLSKSASVLVSVLIASSAFQNTRVQRDQGP